MAKDQQSARDDATIRFAVRPNHDVPYMNYVVWDTKHTRPVAYSRFWLDAALMADRCEANPPFDPSREVYRTP